jgi:micrococcal nuclease
LRYALLVALTIVAHGLLLPGAASAAVCADYPNQAAAQQAADTRDADGDGVYCETLPCPCASPSRDVGGSVGGGGGGSGGGSGGGGGSTPKPKAKKHAQRIDARITSVTDGDTIKVRAFGAKRKYYTVRLIGIDTPETKRSGVPVECGGREASAAMLRLAFTAPEDTDGDGLVDEQGGRGRRVTLVTDPTQDTFDRYGRLLAYVTTKAGVRLQRRMLADGWADVYVFGSKPFQRVNEYRRAGRIAEDNGRGVWGLCSGDFHTAD